MLQKVTMTMAPKISFRATILNSINAHNGMLPPEVYTAPGFSEALTGDSPWKLEDRVRAVIDGLEAEGEIPPFLVIPYRERKSNGLEFKQVLKPRDPAQKMRESTDPTKEAPTNYWPAFVLMTDKIRAAREAALVMQERERTAEAEMVQWFDSEVGDRRLKVHGAKPGAKANTYIVTLYVDLNPPQVSSSTPQVATGPIVVTAAE